ncbi:OmpA family protein [Pseudorhodoferax sp.]|uniref:OmpA family protein n=1 Tax=Pseudorhodoferax sp. TaxID=1993553 RepID=UPI0039E71907
MQNIRTIPRFHRGLALAPLAALLLAACASAPPSNPAVEEARSLYTRAANDADTARSAPVDLRRAQEALARADAALQGGDDPGTVEHYAYLARQSAATALQSGEIARADQAVATASEARNRILITARGAEAEQARRQAEQQSAAAQAAQARADRLQQEMAALQAQQTDRGMVLTLGDVLFDTGRAELKPGAFATLDRLAAFMRDHPERRLEIEGHTDSTGSDALNLALSQRRAESVRAALVNRGVDGARITTKGLGKAVPVAGNDTAEGRQRNRRVEIVISQAR